MSFSILDNNIFVLETKNTHYAFGIDNFGTNHHLHWGRKCRVDDYFTITKDDENSNHSMLDSYRQELTPYGGTMYRDCGLKITFADGCREIQMKYAGYSIDGDVLSVEFEDSHYPLSYILKYKTDEKNDIITRWMTVVNKGVEKVCLERVFSAEFGLPSHRPYKIRNTNGAWSGEFLKTESLLDGGILTFESRRGTSGHNNSPYFIAHQNADEKNGDVYFAYLAYSGCFKVTASRDLFGITRILLGINDFDSNIDLKAGESFDTPYVFCGFSSGFGQMSRNMNRFVLENVLPKSFAQKPLPVLYNSWEATWFDVNVECQTKLAKLASEMGVELFVMDDGWFGERKDDHAGLGDWFVNKEKFPNGLGELIDNVNALGMDFGLWFEPEMVNADSDLFRSHPDWAYHYDTRNPSELRFQRVLNMTRPDVQEYIRDRLDALLTEYNIKYIKWDMNRPLSETGAENLENPKMLWYLHTKAVYDIVDYLKAKHPDVAIESCSSGGGRSDLGALMHYDQVWTSDNTDAVDRMVIQKGYTMLGPVKAMRAWVTDIGSHSKPAPLDFRFNIAMQGSLGIGGNLLKYTEEGLECCKKNIALYKEIRNIVQFGNLYRLLDIDEEEISCVQYMTEDKSEGVVFLASDATRFFKKSFFLNLEGLDEDSIYEIEINGKKLRKSGAFLMNVGIEIRICNRPFYNEVSRIKKV